MLQSILMPLQTALNGAMDCQNHLGMREGNTPMIILQKCPQTFGKLFQSYLRERHGTEERSLVMVSLGLHAVVPRLITTPDSREGLRLISRHQRAIPGHLGSEKLILEFLGMLKGSLMQQPHGLPTGALEGGLQSHLKS
jgi:hypothetical protein